MTQFTFPLCTHLPHPSSPTPISSTTSIIDLSSASLTSLFRLRSHLQEASKLAQANYPETLGSIVIANSPSFFPTVWGWVRVSCTFEGVGLSDVPRSASADKNLCLVVGLV